MKAINSTIKFISFFVITTAIFIQLGSQTVFADVIIDNGDTGTSYTGTWGVSGGTDPYGNDSLWARDGATYSWQFDSQPAGTYEVLMWWSGWSSRGTDIPVTIYSSMEQETISINQHENSGTWNSLGTYYFNTEGSVTLSADVGDTVSACADAVWFKFISDNSPPIAYIDEITPSPAEPGQSVSFSGHGTDDYDSIAAYQWESNIDGQISSSSSFTTSLLSEGTHIISFTVQDNDGLWSETASQTLIVGSVPTEIIIDNNDASTSRDGTWGVSGSSGYYGEDSLWARDGTSCPGRSFTWNFNPPQTGYYEVSMWWAEYYSRSDNVEIDINHEDGTNTVFVNQQTDGGQWNSLGVFFFSVGTGGNVTIYSNYSEYSTCADAVKFNYVVTNEAPVATIEIINPSPAGAGEIIQFSGYGEDPDGTVVSYSWDSSIDGHLSDEPSFTTDSLTEGVHVITFRVQDNEGTWSTTVSETLTVGTPPNSVPSAVIDSITPNPADIYEEIYFTGHGEDLDGSIINYRWESDLDGFLSDQDSFSTTFLSQGSHTITFSVYDNEGAWSEPVTQSLTVDNIPVEMDNDDSSTSYTGVWEVSGGENPYGDDSLWARDGATFTWTYTPESSGYYRVYMWWTEWPSRSTSVPVEIEYDQGTDTVYVDQQTGGGQWNILGMYYYESGASYDITVTAQPGPSSTCVDAIKFEKALDLSPVAHFTADKTIGGNIPCTIQFTDESVGDVTEWLWDFGDGETSTEENPAHEYQEAGKYTISLTATNSYGSDVEVRYSYVHIYEEIEHIYLCHAYASHDDFLDACYLTLEDLGAEEDYGRWLYENPENNKAFLIFPVEDPDTMGDALREEGAHIIFCGHSNFGFGAMFATQQEFDDQRIDDVYYIDDDRFTNFSTDMVSCKIDGMKYGQAYPNWEPVFKDGTSGIMPYDFTEGTPPYNYYLTYTIPGDPETYRIELADGSYLERFPDSKTPAWFSPDGSPPDPIENPEYFITNPDTEFNRCDFVGNWPIASVAGGGYMGEAGYLGYNYQYSIPGAGENTATFTIVIREAGYYSVLASWYPDANNATNAPFTIQHSAGDTVVEVNQQVSDLLNPLGIYYFTEGFYTVELSNDADGIVIADALGLMYLGNPISILQPEFNSSKNYGDAPLSVQFTDMSSVYRLDDYAAEITSWQWEFGDGATSYGQDPAHVYTEPGTYSVTLTVLDSSGGLQSVTKENFIVVEDDMPVHAEFAATNRIGGDKAVVSFIDQSYGNITNWHWDFGDGTTSSEQNPVHYYTEVGAYTITLIVTGTEGSDTVTKENYINIIVGTTYVDNTFHTKPHFQSGSTVQFGKVICDTGDVKIPEDELRYSRMFYLSCNSANYYTGTFHRGIMFFTTGDYYAATAHYYLRYYLLGLSDEEILSNLNRYQPIYEYYNFDLIPPSMR